MATRLVVLEGHPPWGFRMAGGADTPLRIIRVNPGSKAEKSGVREGDLITEMNGIETIHMSHSDANTLQKSARSGLRLKLIHKDAKKGHWKKKSTGEKKFVSFEMDRAGIDGDATKQEEEICDSKEVLPDDPSLSDHEKFAEEIVQQVFGDNNISDTEKIVVESKSAFKPPGDAARKKCSLVTFRQSGASQSWPPDKSKLVCSMSNGATTLSEQDSNSVARFVLQERRKELELDNSSLLEALDGIIAKWSSSEDIHAGTTKQQQSALKPGSSGGPQQPVWTPAAADSPSLDRKNNKDYKPVTFDSNSLKRDKRSDQPGSTNIEPKESFAWKDSTLDRKLRELEDRAKSQGSIRPADANGFDRNIDKSIGNWSSLPKAPNPDVILLQRAREEKKVKKYLEENYKHRSDLVSPDPDLQEESPLDQPPQPKKYQGVGPKTRDGTSSGYTSEPEVGRSSYSKFSGGSSNRFNDRGSPPRSPPAFSKHESRFEREQRIKVGSVDAYVPGQVNPNRISPPPVASSAQKQYDQARFRVQPGRIEDYSLGRGSLAQQEAQKAHRAGCSITRYSSSHSFNPLISSKSEHNLSSQTYQSPQKFHLQSALKDGYESDSTLVFKRRDNYTPSSQTPTEARSTYTQIQKGGEIPTSGLRMSLPDKQRAESRTKYNESEVNIHYKSPVRREEKEYVPEDELRKRQEDQMRKFYEGIEHKKEQELLQDMQNRKHHDTLLPTQKSPIPLNRYEDFSGTGGGGQQGLLSPQSTLNRSINTTYKMVSRAMYNFQAQNHRELSFKKGDLVYIRRQVDDNWYEGERNAMIGIFPVTYVEIIPNDQAGSMPRGTSIQTSVKMTEQSDGQGKAKFNFQAQTPMELSLIKGEMVTLTRRVDQNWFEGRIGSRKGIFPSSYVDVLYEPGESRGLSPSPVIKPVAAPAAHSILKNGSLPVSSYVPNYSVQSPYSTINSRPGSSMSQTTQQMSTSIHIESKNEPVPYRALYNYKPQNEDEVELTEGDLVYVMEKCDDGWFVGTSQRSGIFGTFPGNYVAKA